MDCRAHEEASSIGSSPQRQAYPSNREVRDLIVGHFLVSPYVMKLVNERGAVAHLSAIQIKPYAFSPSAQANFEVSFQVTDGHDEVGTVQLRSLATVESLHIEKLAKGQKLMVTLALEGLNSTGLILPRSKLILTTKYDDFSELNSFVLWGLRNPEFDRRLPIEQQAFTIFISQMKRIRPGSFVSAPSCRLVM